MSMSLLKEDVDWTRQSWFLEKEMRVRDGPIEHAKIYNHETYEQVEFVLSIKEFGYSLYYLLLVHKCDILWFDLWL